MYICYIGVARMHLCIFPCLQVENENGHEGPSTSTSDDDAGLDIDELNGPEASLSKILIQSSESDISRSICQ